MFLCPDRNSEQTAHLAYRCEFDRIQHFYGQFGNTEEEMGTASAAQIAGLFHILFLGIRVLSNNTTLGETYHTKRGEVCQEYVYNVVKIHVGEKLKR